MTNEEIDKLVYMNTRLLIVLGYALAYRDPPLNKDIDSIEYKKYLWLMNAVENLVYLDKPLPPMP